MWSERRIGRVSKRADAARPIGSARSALGLCAGADAIARVSAPMRALLGRTHALACAALLMFAAALPLAATANDSIEMIGADIVHREKSIYRNVMVAETDAYRCMIFTRRIRILQTCVDRRDQDRLVLTYSQGMMAATIAQPQAKRVLVIGLGGGVIARAMHDVSPGIEIDTVEIDPAVVDVAKEYFGFRESAQIRSYVNDGRVFVRQQLRKRSRYDIVVIDACDSDFVPEHLLTQEFMRQVRTLLNPGGVLVANSLAKGRLIPHESATYVSVFGNVLSVDVEGENRIILTGRDGDVDLDRLKRNAPLMAERLRKVGVSAQALLEISKPIAAPKGVRPLTDQYSPANLLFND